jgi:20S proteasome alpha/beta subunit
MYLEFLARALGKESDKLNKYLEDNYKQNIKIKDARKLGINAFKFVFGSDFKEEDLEIFELIEN